MTIAALNDQFRSDTGKYQKHRVVMTASVAALYQSYRDSLMRQVRAFSDFNEENDPFNEHDFGSIDFFEYKVFLEDRLLRQKIIFNRYSIRFR